MVVDYKGLYEFRTYSAALLDLCFCGNLTTLGNMDRHYTLKTLNIEELQKIFLTCPNYRPLLSRGWKPRKDWEANRFTRLKQQFGLLNDRSVCTLPFFSMSVS